MTGSATATTVPSRKAMLDPRIATASVQRGFARWVKGRGRPSRPGGYHSPDAAARGPPASNVRNAATVGRFHGFAADNEMTPAQLSVAWGLAKQPAFVPVVGARTRKHLDSER